MAALPEDDAESPDSDGVPAPAELAAALRAAVIAADPAVRLVAIRRLRDGLDALETEAVADALRHGLSWREIGQALGVTKQAAHRRHSRSVEELDRAVEVRDHGGSARVSAPVRRAIRLARREALAAGVGTVGTEHLLIGLLACGDEATSELLRRYGVTSSELRAALSATVEMPLEEALRRQVARDTGSAGSAEGDAGGPALSPLAHRVLAHALDGAVERPEHPLSALDLLYALLRYDHGGAARTLADLGVSAVDVRRAVLSRTRLEDLPPPVTATAPRRSPGGAGRAAGSG